MISKAITKSESIDCTSGEWNDLECSSDGKFIFNNEQNNSKSLCQSDIQYLETDKLLKDLDLEYESFESAEISHTLTVEVCRNEGSPSCIDHPLLKTKCKQKHMSLRLLLFYKNSTTDSIDLLVPSHCECVIYSKQA